MKFVILTGRGPEHRYVTRALADAFPEALAAIIVADPAPRPALARVRSYVRRYTVPQLYSRIVAKVGDRVTGASEQRRHRTTEHLFPAGDDGGFPRPELFKSVPSHNTSPGLAVLDSIEPDIIAVYGTGVIREPVIQRARLAILNLHTGISPRYRGSDSVFWALHNGEPEWIGATVHALDARLDAGPIYGTRKVTLEPDDDEGSLFAKCVEVGSPLYVEVIRAMAEGRAAPVPQQLSEGREYRFVDRTLTAERRVARLLAQGLLRGRSAPA